MLLRILLPKVSARSKNMDDGSYRYTLVTLGFAQKLVGPWMYRPFPDILGKPRGLLRRRTSSVKGHAPLLPLHPAC